MERKVVNESNHSGVINNLSTWEEKSGPLRFLSLVPQEVAKFNQTFDFNIRPVVSPPPIDGNREAHVRVGFVLVIYNSLLSDWYCLYSILKEKALYGYIGIYRDDGIKTIMELRPITGFKEGKIVLFDWLRALVRASCEKIMV
jgi:hypothetical protein